MGAALALATRQAIIDGHRGGTSYAALAREHNVAYGSVVTLCRRFDADGEAAVRPRYDHCARRGQRSDRLIYRAACWLKRRHRTWGAPLIHLRLEERYAELAVPSVRTMQRWFRAAGLTEARSHPPRPPKQWAERVHQIWQVDANEQQRLADGTPVCWLTVTDEHSGAILAAPAFPPRAHYPGAAGAGANSTDRHLPAVGTARGDQS